MTRPAPQMKHLRVAEATTVLFLGETWYEVPVELKQGWRLKLATPQTLRVRAMEGRDWLIGEILLKSATRTSSSRDVQMGSHLVNCVQTALMKHDLIATRPQTPLYAALHTVSLLVQHPHKIAEQKKGVWMLKRNWHVKFLIELDEEIARQLPNFRLLMDD